ACIIVESIKLGFHVANSDLSPAIRFTSIWHWYTIAGATLLTAVLLFRLRTLGIHFVVGLVAGWAWMSFVSVVILYLTLLPTWIGFVVVVILLGYPPYFVIRWLVQDKCSFSRSLLEHLAMFAPFALTQIFIGFAVMLYPQVFKFYF